MDSWGSVFIWRLGSPFFKKRKIAGNGRWSHVPCGNEKVDLVMRFTPSSGRLGGTERKEAAGTVRWLTMRNFIE